MLNVYTRSFHQMSTRLRTHVLTLPSLAFLCVLVLSFPLYLHWILSIFLLEKIFFLTFYLLSFIIIGLGLFWPAFFFPILYVQSRSTDEILMFTFVDIVSITKSSVTSSLVSTIPWTKRQFRREYCSCLSISFSRFSTFLFITDTFSSKFLIFCSLSFLFSHTRQILFI